MMMSLGGSVGGLDHPLQHTPHTHLLLLHTLPALSWCVLRSRTPFHPSVRSRVHTTSSTRVKLEPRQQNQAGKGTLHTGSPGEGGGRGVVCRREPPSARYKEKGTFLGNFTVLASTKKQTKLILILDNVWLLKNQGYA